MRIAFEVIFGLSLTSISVCVEEEALVIVNGTVYGLAGYVWTNDLIRALRFTVRLLAGMSGVDSGGVHYLAFLSDGAKAGGIAWGGGN